MITDIHELDVDRFIVEDDGKFPNSDLFVLLYKKAFSSDWNTADIVKTFERNNWTNSWVNGIYDFHHYHSNTHEVIAVTQVSVTVLLGGSAGTEKQLSPGDVIIIPAGVAHKRQSSSDDFECTGAYPDGIQYDLKMGEAGERPFADENIKAVLLPDNDPVYGAEGPVALNWKVQ
ncbi:MAG: cupin domain-containing protein [Ginsengibacter sp.]